MQDKAERFLDRVDKRKVKKALDLEKFVRVVVRFRPRELESMDQAVKWGSYTSRAEFIRSCVRVRLSKYKRQQHDYLKDQEKRNQQDDW